MLFSWCLGFAEVCRGKGKIYDLICGLKVIFFFLEKEGTEGKEKGIRIQR